jgi:hypothetical protein
MTPLPQRPDGAESVITMGKISKQNKSQRQAAMAERMTAKAEAMAKADDRNPSTDDMQAAIDVANELLKPSEVKIGEPVATTPVEAAVPDKKPRKISNIVAIYRAQPVFPMDHVIKIKAPAKDKPKRRLSQERYELYADGMSVGDYIEKSHKAGNLKSLASNDVRWDYCKGFIDVVPPTETDKK